MQREPMTEDEIYAKVTDVFRDVFDDDELTPTAATVAADVEEWDSLSHIRLILSLEKAFGVRFSTVEVGSMENVGDLARMLGDKTR